VRECCNGDEASQRKRPKFDPSPHQNPLTDLHQNWLMWLCPGRHILGRNDFIWRILVGCSEMQELKKALQTSHPMEDVKVTYLGSRNPLTDRYKILRFGCRPGHNHTSQFWWRSVKGFWCGEGSNFVLFHWLASSPLQHSRTTVRVCDASV